MKKLKPGTVVHSPVLALRWTHHGVNAREASLGARLAKALVRRERELRSYPGQRILTETKKAFIYRNCWSGRVCALLLHAVDKEKDCASGEHPRLLLWSPRCIGRGIAWLWGPVCSKNAKLCISSVCSKNAQNTGSQSSLGAAMAMSFDLLYPAPIALR